MLRARILPATIAMAVGLALPAVAAWTESVAVDGSTFSTATLQPPTNVSAACYFDGTWYNRVSWTPTTSTFADGYDLYRDGLNYQHIAGRNTSFYDDHAVLLSLTFTYHLQSTAGLWTSANSSSVSVTVTNCTVV